MSIDARGAAEGEIQASLKKAWDQGYDAVTIKNYTSPDGRKGTVLVVKDLAQLRSPLARFDPKNRNSADLLAGLAGAGILAPMFLSGDNRNQHHRPRPAQRRKQTRTHSGTRGGVATPYELDAQQAPSNQSQS